jgi:hypothetical protein
VRRFNENDTWAPEVFDVGEDDLDHSGDREDWPHSSGEKHAQCQREQPSSKAASSTGSGASRSLDGHKKVRGVALARLEVRKAERLELGAELLVAELDAAVGLSRRSRNSSQASSLRDDQSVVSRARRSRRRSTSGQERSLRGSLGEVEEGQEDLPIVPLNDSHATTPFCSIQESGLRDSVLVEGDVSVTRPEAHTVVAGRPARARSLVIDVPVEPILASPTIVCARCAPAHSVRARTTPAKHFNYGAHSASDIRYSREACGGFVRTINGPRNHRRN